MTQQVTSRQTTGINAEVQAALNAKATGTGTAFGANNGDQDLSGYLLTSTLGTNVQIALGQAINSPGSILIKDGALGTPASVTLTNATGLPMSTGLTGLGANVTTALGINVGTTGAFQRNNDGFNGTVGVSTPATGAFTTVVASSTIALAAGTAALPSLIPTGDTNTGIWFPAADTVAVSTNGVQRVTVNNNGNVGIGASSPTRPLTIIGSSVSPNAVIDITNNESGPAQSFLQALSPSLTASQICYMAFGKAASNNNRAAVSYVHVADGSSSNRIELGFYGGPATPIFALLTTGFIGLGTASPSSQLHLVGQTGNGNVWIQLDKSSGDTNSPTIVARKARGSIAAPTQTLANDFLLSINGRGYNSGGNFNSNDNAALNLLAAENQTTTNQGTYITFETTSIGSTTKAERVRITDIALTLADGINVVMGASTGHKYGTATSQKMGWWNATPIIQPTTAVASATIVGGAGTTVKEDHTFDGYTIAQIVKALRNMGKLA